MNEGGDNDKLGRGAVWKGQIDPCLHQNHVFAVRPSNGVDPYWINLTTQSAYLKHFFLRRANQSTNLASISSSNIKEAPIVWPPPDEQSAILAHVTARLNALKTLCEKIEAHVKKLQEYRQALITAAVTGKVDVTGEAA
jgi:type I restriction enzyme S subunit